MRLGSLKPIADHPADQPRGLYTRGGPRVPGGAARNAQRVSASSRAHGGSEGVDVGVPARPHRRWGRGRKAGPKPPQQEPLRASLPQSAAPRHGRAAIRGPPHLRPAPEQGLVVPLRLQALDRNKWY